MHERKKIIKSEVQKNIRSISIMLIVVFALYNGLTITGFLNVDSDSRLGWVIDFSVFSALLSIIYSCIQYLTLKQKIFISVDLLNKKEDTNKITMRERNSAELEIKIHIEGKNRKIPSDLKIVFPHWLDIQVKPRSYLKEMDSFLLIDLNYLIRERENVNVTEIITVDLIGNSEEKNTEEIESILDLGIIKRILVRFTNKPIEVKIS